MLPQHLRAPLETKLLAAVQNRASFGGGEEWLDSALNEVNAYVDAENRAAAAGAPGHVPGSVRLHWCSLLHAMRWQALRSPPVPLSVLESCYETCKEALRQILKLFRLSALEMLSTGVAG